MNTLAKGFIFLFCSLLTILCYGQGNWTCYNVERFQEKKLINVISNVNGSTWFITTKGIHVYDGEGWSIIDKNNYLTQDNISTFLIDGNNKIWIGTRGKLVWDGWIAEKFVNGGISIYDTDNDSWDYINKDELEVSAPNVKSIFEASNGDIWITLSEMGENGSLVKEKGGLIQYVNGEFIEHRDDLPDNYSRFVNGIYEDKNQRIWFWSRNGSIFFYEDGKIQFPSEENGYKSIGRPTAVFIDNNNKLWFGAARNKIIMWDGDKWNYFDKKNGVKTKDDHVRKFYHMSDGSMVFLSWNGLYVYDGESYWQHYKIKRTPTSNMNMYSSIVEDKAGKLFIYIDKRFGIFNGNELEVSKKVITKIFYDRLEDNLWMLTEKGVEYRVNGEWEINEEIKDAWGITKDKYNSIWILTRENGIFTYNGSTFNKYDEANGLNSNIIKMYVKEKSGKIWIGTGTGVCEYE